MIFHLQLVQYKVRDYIYVPIPRINYEPLRFEPLGFSFLIFFASILLVQFFSMLWHRYGTVLHLLASTDLKLCSRKFNINQMEVEDVVQTVKVLQQIKGFEEEDLPVPDYDTTNEQTIENENQQKHHYASKMDAYNYHEANFYSRIGQSKQNASSLSGNYTSNATGTAATAANSQYPYPRQHRLLKSQIINGGRIAASGATATDIDAESKLYADADGAASVYVPMGQASSVQTYNSNYFQTKYRNLKKSSHNKSLDVVFRRRWHALSQGKGHQIKQKPRVKVNDIFLSQVSSNIQSVQRNSKQSFDKSSSNDHTIHINDN